MNIPVPIAKFLSNSSYRRYFMSFTCAYQYQTDINTIFVKIIALIALWRSQSQLQKKKKILCFTKTTVMMQNNSLIYYIFESTKLNADSNC